MMCLKKRPTYVWKYQLKNNEGRRCSSTVYRDFRTIPETTDLDSSPQEKSVGGDAGETGRKEERKGEGDTWFVFTSLSQHSPCGIGHLLTARVTIVEAEVTRVRGEEGWRADVKLVTNVHVWECVCTVCVCFMLCPPRIQDLMHHQVLRSL